MDCEGNLCLGMPFISSYNADAKEISRLTHQGSKNQYHLCYRPVSQLDEVGNTLEDSIKTKDSALIGIKHAQNVGWDKAKNKFKSQTKKKSQKSLDKHGLCLDVIIPGAFHLLHVPNFDPFIQVSIHGSSHMVVFK